MASSSSSATSLLLSQKKYDVFLSFRGEDTRQKFTSHLYAYLKNRGIFTFQDDKRLEGGDSISEELLKAIEESQVAIIVFSKNYATSRWCLNELAKIMECKDRNGQIVIPIFYDVDPSHVRHQTGSFVEAFVKHDLRYKDDAEGMQRVQGWRNVLTAAADLKGHDIRDGIESDCIQDIVAEVSSKLCRTSVSYLKNIVGIDAHLEKVKFLLKMEINDVRIVGMWGMGGIGKTTIARAIFDTLSSQFEAACFIEDIKEKDESKMHDLQNVLLSELLRDKDVHVNNKEEGKHMIARRLRFKKVLVVLDDIDHIDQLDYLAGDLSWYGNGSKIIATTRNKHMVKGMKDTIYEVTTLPDNDAIQLFNQHAFKEEVPDKCFEELSWMVVSHAGGLPLALKVWGSFLHKRDVTEWESAIEQMRTNSNSEIIKKLKISYDGLESIQQDIFLDIACFFRRRKKDEAMPILKSCYSRVAEIGLRVLIEKSLVFVDGERVQMHDLIEEMGKYIVKMQKDSGKCSRIWDVEDFKEGMINNTGNMTVEAIWLRLKLEQQISFNTEAIKSMTRLRILSLSNLYKPTCSSSSNCHDESIENLSNNLCWLVWHDYPWKSLPENFKPQRLVHLDLRRSSLHHLWNETKVYLTRLTMLYLSDSKRLIGTPNFTEMPNLEILYLSYCTSLEEVHPSIGCCRKLRRLGLYHCYSLVRFAYINVESLESLNLAFCHSLEKFPEILGIMKPELEINMAGSGIRKLPLSFFQHQTHLTELDFQKYFSNYVVLEGVSCNIASLPSSICMLEGLVKLDLSCCTELESLPEEIGDLENLEKLYARNTLISQPPSSIVRLNKLKVLDFSKDDYSASYSENFVFPQLNGGLRSLEILNLNGCKLRDGGLPQDIGCLSSLKELNLRRNNFEHLPLSIAQLGALQSLDLRECKRLEQLPEFPQQLHTIFADWTNDWICNSLFQNTSSLQHDISASNSFSLRVFTSWNEGKEIPSWFQHRGSGTNVSVNLPENWYISDDFLGFAVCYTGRLIDTTAYLVALWNDGVSWMIQKLALSNQSEYGIHFFLVPLSCLWDTSKAYGKTPNDYVIFSLYFGEEKSFGLRLLYKDDLELEAVLQMTEDNDEPTEHGVMTRKSRYDSSEHHDCMTNEASCSSNKKQRSCS